MGVVAGQRRFDLTAMFARVYDCQCSMVSGMGRWRIACKGGPVCSS